MKAANWVLDTFRALPRYLLVLTAVSALALVARAAVPSFPRACVAVSELPRSAYPVAPAVSALPPAAMPAAMPADAIRIGSNRLRFVAYTPLPGPLRAWPQPPARGYFAAAAQLRSRKAD